MADLTYHLADDDEPEKPQAPPPEPPELEKGVPEPEEFRHDESPSNPTEAGIVPPPPPPEDE